MLKIIKNPLVHLKKSNYKIFKFLKNKAKTLDDIYQNAQYILNEDIKIASEDIKLLDANSKKIIDEFLGEFKNMSSPNKEGLEKLVNSLNQ